MAILTIERKKELTNILAKYEVYIDEQLVGTLRNGETKEFATTEGQHNVIVKTKRNRSSQEISINTAEPNYLTVSCTKIYVMMNLLSNVFFLLIVVIFIFWGVRTITRNFFRSILYWLLLLGFMSYSSFCEKILILESK